MARAGSAAFESLRPARDTTRGVSVSVLQCQWLSSLCVLCECTCVCVSVCVCCCLYVTEYHVCALCRVACKQDGPPGIDPRDCSGEGIAGLCWNTCDSSSCTCGFPIPGVDAYCNATGTAACQPASDGKNCVVNFVASNSPECCANPACAAPPSCCGPRGCLGAVQCYVLQANNY